MIPLAVITLFWLSPLFSYKGTKKKHKAPSQVNLHLLTICARYTMIVELYNTGTGITDLLEKNRLKHEGCTLWKGLIFLCLKTPVMNFSWSKKKRKCQLCLLDITVKGLLVTFCISKTNIIASQDIHCGEHWMLKKVL